MKKLLVAIAALVVVGAASSIASAQVRYTPRHYHRGINGRELNQQRRISRGISNGRLTARETARLERREAHINRIEHRDRLSGGRLTYRERHNLNRRLNGLSRSIYRQKHDWQGRY